MDNMKDLQDIVAKVQKVDDGVNSLIVPLLKDTIADSNRHNKRLFVSNMALILAMLIISISSMILVAIQNKQYADFLSQFEFESETSTIYQDADDFSNNINSGITINR